MNKALGKIDWLSWSVKMPVGEGGEMRHKERIIQTMGYRFPVLPDLSEAVAQPVAKRPPYNRKMTLDGITVLYNATIPHFLIEISGTGCTKLGDEKCIELLMTTGVKDRLTRLDAALDIECEVTPTEVFDAGFSERYKTHNRQISATGETIYIGSAKSALFVRVYRYNKPHERHKFLRFEYVARRELAKATAQNIIDKGLDSTLRGLENAFEWQHSIIAQYATDDSLERPPDPKKTSAGTLLWIEKQVIPAMVRLDANGDLTDTFWRAFAEHFPALMLDADYFAF